MSTRINTNTTAYMAASNLAANSDKVSQNIQRLSSGLRINSAADDAAGLVISESMQAQVTGLTQATSNRDYPLMQAILLFMIMAVLIANLVADLLYGVLDPRARKAA